jgi:MerR family mercuric resistance operon transcriptional regulator
MRKNTASRSEGLSIGEVSRLTGVNIETIRYYERISVLPAVSRTGSGRRVYGSRETRTLAFIRRARELGFTLDEIRGLIELGAPGHASCFEVRDIAVRHLEAIRARITDLKRLERLLASTIVKCSGKKVPDCPIIDVLDVLPNPGRGEHRS